MGTSAGPDGPAYEDLTARARIRDAAVQHFADDGFARATIRDIARTAGVSPGLVRHHFGSKDALRGACDEHVSEALRGVNDQALADSQRGNLGLAAAYRQGLRPYQQYVARALVDGSTSVASLFDDMVRMTEDWLARDDQSRADPPLGDRRARAALIAAMAAGIPLLHQHVSRAMGVDMFDVEGDRRVAVAMLDIYSHSLMSAELAASASVGFDRLRDETSSSGEAAVGHHTQEQAHD
jgi:AcrR family transcriptional regulator